jgi:LuxR family transcriptional regulator
VTDLKSAKEIFAVLQEAANELGFEHCAYGLRMPLPLSNPKVIVMNDYPEPWQRRYQDARYLRVDPSVRHAARSRSPFIWSDAAFESVPALWDEARSFGLGVGWAQSSIARNGVMGMLTLSRSAEPLTKSELTHKSFQMEWLCGVAHIAMVQALLPEAKIDAHLTEREVEVLRWTGDGKTAQEIADILLVSVDTVNFHIRNAMHKLRTPNKTAAVVQAAVLGLLI